jgi:hypothetical protein
LRIVFAITVEIRPAFEGSKSWVLFAAELEGSEMKLMNSDESTMQ